MLNSNQFIASLQPFFTYVCICQHGLEMFSRKAIINTVLRFSEQIIQANLVNAHSNSALVVRKCPV